MAKQTFSNCPHVTIACLSLEVTEKEYAYLVTLLSDEEKERSLRRVPEVRRRAVVSRGYLRVLLGSLTGVSPEKCKESVARTTNENVLTDQVLEPKMFN